MEETKRKKQKQVLLILLGLLLLLDGWKESTQEDNMFTHRAK